MTNLDRPTPADSPNVCTFGAVGSGKTDAVRREYVELFGEHGNLIDLDPFRTRGDDSTASGKGAL